MEPFERCFGPTRAAWIEEAYMGLVTSIDIDGYKYTEYHCETEILNRKNQ